jgi:hypothetical protein
MPASRNNNGWYAGGGFDYLVHKGALVDVLLGVEYQHFEVSAEPAFCLNPGCAVLSVRDFSLSATGAARREAPSPFHNRRSATSSTRWLSTFFRIRSARWRVGRMFSWRLSRLMRVQIEVAVATDSSSDKVA